MKVVSRIVLVVAALYVAAAVLHSGVMVGSFTDPAAAVAESAIAAALIAGWAYGRFRRRSAAVAALAAQSFGLALTFLGRTMLVAFGPFRVVDAFIHAVLAALLVAGVALAAAAMGAERRRPGEHPLGR